MYIRIIQGITYCDNESVDFVIFQQTIWCGIWNYSNEL